jgi:hypothetical protein
MFSMKYTVIRMKMQAGNKKAGADDDLSLRKLIPANDHVLRFPSCCSRVPILLAMIREKPPRTQLMKAIKPKASTSADRRPHPRRIRPTEDRSAAPPDISPKRSEILPLTSRTA